MAHHSVIVPPRLRWVRPVRVYLDALLPPDLELAVLGDLSGLLLIVGHRRRFFTVGRGTQCVAGRGPEVKGGGVSDDLKNGVSYTSGREDAVYGPGYPIHRPSSAHSPSMF